MCISELDINVLLKVVFWTYRVVYYDPVVLRKINLEQIHAGSGDRHIKLLLKIQDDLKKVVFLIRTPCILASLN